VYHGDSVAGLIDWEFAAPADRLCDPAALVGLSVRGPRPDATDHDRRVAATRVALDAIADGYGMDDVLRRGLPAATALVLDDTAAHWRATGVEVADVDRVAWRAAWFREHADELRV
jgi:hypothetical protein